MCMPDTYTRMHMQAFARGQRAIYTSPIKALSNQKFAEFKEWFRKKGVRGEVSLLTGDIKIRAPPGTRNELIICTSEILRNKLVKASGAAPPADAAVVAPAADGARGYRCEGIRTLPRNCQQLLPHLLAVGAGNPVDPVRLDSVKGLSGERR